MYKALRKLVPGFIKRRFKNLINSIVNRNENMARLDAIQNQVHALSVHAERISAENTRLVQRLAQMDKNQGEWEEKILFLYKNSDRVNQELADAQRKFAEIHTRINEEMTEVGHQIQVLETRLKEIPALWEAITNVKNANDQRLEGFKYQMDGVVKDQLQIHSELMELVPEHIPLNQECENWIAGFYEHYPTKRVSHVIHKNDLMFRHSWVYRGSLGPTYYDYLVVGYNQANICSRVTNAFFGERNDIRMLDFASGYGRATRFLCNVYPAENITVSDIKPWAVDFQTRTFGVKGIYSFANPADFSTTERFHFIFVGSLFSHLPEATFSHWLRKLTLCLEDDGILAITVHDQSLGSHQSGLSYHETSEDEQYQYVADSIKDTSNYGVTYVDEAYVADQIRKLTKKYQYRRYPKLFGKLQDVYLISQQPLNREIPDLEVYP